MQFSSPKETDAIVPALLKRVWETDNDKMKVLFEMGTNGAVSGDSFIKIAYEEAWTDSIGRLHPGRVRILPLNAAYCYPEYHPHDRSRLIRMKIKYRFWGCVDEQTEALTRTGWKSYKDLSTDDEILTLDPETDAIRWQPVQAVNVYQHQGYLTKWSGKVDALTTDNHRWLAQTVDGNRFIARSSRREGNDPALEDLYREDKIIVGGGTPLAFADAPKWADEFVETVAWYICDGSDHVNQQGYHSVHLSGKKDHKVAAWRRLAEWWSQQGATFREGVLRKNGQTPFYLGKGVVSALQQVTKRKQVDPEFLSQLTYAQAELFYRTLMVADGHVRRSSERWGQVDQGRVDTFQMLAAMLGKRTRKPGNDHQVQVYSDRYVNAKTVRANADELEPYDGDIWCPTVESGVWFARRNGSTYWTGNTSPQGTRSVYAYVEILTEETIEEYINDELISSRPNPIGQIPIVHIPNIPVPSSPWGLSDCQDIIGLNLHYNEVATDIADIVNYHAAPVTVIVGAKASQLEKGAKKVWGGLPKDSQVFNLEGGGQGMMGALQYLETVKRAMHEMVGVPETALGQVQPISNTSGVALSIQFQPLMNRWGQKVAQYSEGLQRINELILLTLAVKEPDSLVWNPTTETQLAEGQVSQLDPSDPITYITTVHFPPPLPLDRLVVLNEIQMLSQMGLESREGALRILGEEFPEEKLEEIRAEMVDDAIADGALSLLRAQLQKEIMDLTGMMPGVDGGPSTPIDPTMAMTADGEMLGDGAPGPAGTMQDQAGMAVLSGEQELRNALVTRAYGTTVPQKRKPDSRKNDM